MEERPNLSNFLRTTISRLSSKINAILLGFGGFVLTALGFAYFDLGSSVFLIKGHIIIVILFLFTFILAMIEVIYDFYKDSINIKDTSITRVRRTCPPQLISPNPEAEAVLILDPSDKFHQDDLVSICYKTADVEIEIGYGEVINIHEGNRLIQVEILYMSNKDILKNLLNNNNEYLKKVEVRPHISGKKLEEFRSKREQENATR